MPTPLPGECNALPQLGPAKLTIKEDKFLAKEFAKLK